MKIVKRTVLFLVIILLVVAGIQIKGGYDKYIAALNEKSLETAISELQSKENYTKYDEFDSLVAVEDRRFYNIYWTI